MDAHRAGIQRDVAQQVDRKVLAIGHAVHRAQHVHAFRVPSRLVFEHAVNARNEIVEFVITLGVGRGGRDDLALLISQVDLHAGQRFVDVGLVNAIAIHVVPHRPEMLAGKYSQKS